MSETPEPNQSYKPAFKPTQFARSLNDTGAIDVSEIEVPETPIFDMRPKDSDGAPNAVDIMVEEELKEEATGEPSGKKAIMSMSMGTLISRLLGFVKLALTLWVLGSATDISDSFAFANQAPNILYLLIGGGALNSILVPQIIKALKRKDQGKDYINKLVTLVALISGGVTVLLVLLSPIIVNVFGDGWSEDRKSLTWVFLIWCLPQIFFYVMYTIFGQVLNARSVFGPYMWAPIVNNIIAIAGLLIFAAVFGYVGNDNNAIADWTTGKTLLLMGTTTFGIVAQAIVLMGPIRKLGYSLKPSFQFRGMGFRETAQVAVWAIGVVLINQLSYLVIFWVAVQAGNQRESFQGDPSAVAGNAAYDAAAMLISFPNGIIAVSVATFMFTRMAKSADKGDTEGVLEHMSSAQRTIGVFTMFFFAIFIVLSGQIGMVVGGDNAVAGRTLGYVILAFCANIPLMSINFVYQRIFYSLNDSKTPFLIQLPVTFVTAALAFAALLLPTQLITIGLALNGVITITLAIGLDLYFVKKKVGRTDISRIMNTFGRLFASSMVSGLAGFLLLLALGGYNLERWPWHSKFEAFLVSIPVAALMGVVYVFCINFFKVQEFKDSMRPVANRLPDKFAKYLR